MTNAARYDRDDVLEALRPEAVIAHFGIKGRRMGREFRTRTCPACGERSRGDAIAINLETGRWHCHAHGCSGDVLALLAGLAGLDVRSQFREVLELAAELAGVTPSTADPNERARRRADIARRAEQQRVEQVAEEERRRNAAIEIATPTWGRLSTSSRAGQAYLERRGVAGVVERGLVRFNERGDVCVALYTADGHIVNVVRRRIDDGDPKVLGLKDCPTAGTFIDSIADITHGRDVVLVEGVFDALTARLAWPRATILGAHGAANLPKIVAPAVRRVLLARAQLVLVPHADKAGVEAMHAAAKLAIAAGMRHRRDLHVVEVAGKDLNDDWREGWRPR